MTSNLNRNLPTIDASRFSMVPRADIPRSTFVTTHNLKTTFNAGWLIPFHLDEVLPGDVHQGNVTIFARLATPLFPVMDYISLETFFFFVPNRILWTNWPKMMGERTNPADSISYTVPRIISNAGGYAINSVFDYFGLPTVGQVTAGQTIQASALPLRGYYKIWNAWFRDQNLQNSLNEATGDSDEIEASYTLQRRNKRHDYFTSALPWPIKGGVDISLPMGGTANVLGIGTGSTYAVTAGNPVTVNQTGSIAATGWAGYGSGAGAAGTSAQLYVRTATTSTGSAPLITADLSTATGATINALRLAFQTQRLLERDARSGTRYTELLRSHFGVTPEDTRLQRPEYIGGGRSPIQTQAIPQTSATGLTGGTSPLGALGAAATASDQHRYSYHATEHGYIIGLIHATAEITYQQGLHRTWTRRTRYDYYWPAFAHLGEQAIRNDELYATGVDATDEATFGYQERWAEYRHRPSRITGSFRSTQTPTNDPWHLAQRFTALPTLNTTFIQDDPPFARVLAAGSQADGMQVLLDTVFKIKTTRAMPMFSVPGQIDRF